jgi:hypothetical protein
MAESAINCNNTGISLEELLLGALVKRTSDGTYGFRTVITELAQGAITDEPVCAGPPESIESALRKAIIEDPITGKYAIQLIVVTS